MKEERWRGERTLAGTVRVGLVDASGCGRGSSGMATELPTRDDQGPGGPSPQQQLVSSLPFSVEALMRDRGVKDGARLQQRPSSALPDHPSAAEGFPRPPGPSSPVKSEASDPDDASWVMKSSSPPPRTFSFS